MRFKGLEERGIIFIFVIADFLFVGIDNYFGSLRLQNFRVDFFSGRWYLLGGGVDFIAPNNHFVGNDTVPSLPEIFSEPQIGELVILLI
ncbi:MAG TPA: hypothetical protein PKV71_19835 [Calditrichia bacterium]|nr:hypothetical protein [Calditrichia bacterium]